MKGLIEILQRDPESRGIQTLGRREIPHGFESPKDHDARVGEEGVGIKKVRSSEEITQYSPACGIGGKMFPAPLLHRLVSYSPAESPLLLKLFLVIEVLGRLLKGCENALPWEGNAG
jgi:hypothetical protein